MGCSQGNNSNNNTYAANLTKTEVAMFRLSGCWANYSQNPFLRSDTTCSVNIVHPGWHGDEIMERELDIDIDYQVDFLMHQCFYTC